MGFSPLKLTNTSKRRSAVVDLLFVVLFMAIFLFVIIGSGIYSTGHSSTEGFDENTATYDISGNDFSHSVFLDHCWIYIPNITDAYVSNLFNDSTFYTKLPYAKHANITDYGFNNLGNSAEWFHTANNEAPSMSTYSRNNRTYYSAAYMTHIQTGKPNYTLYISIPRINGNVSVYSNGKYKGTIGDSIGSNVEFDMSCGYTSVPVSSDENGEITLILIANSDVYVPNPGIVSIPSIDTSSTNTNMIVISTVWLFLILFSSFIAIIGLILVSKTFTSVWVSHVFVFYILSLTAYLLIDNKYIVFDSLASTLLNNIVIIISAIFSYFLISLIFAQSEQNSKYRILKYDSFIVLFAGLILILLSLLDIRILSTNFMRSATILFTWITSAITFMKVMLIYINEKVSFICLIMSETMFFMYISLANTSSSYYYIPTYSIIFMIAIITMEIYFLRNYVKQFNELSMQSELMATEIMEKTAHISEINKNLSAKNKELIENEEARKNIMSNVSHDLRTPITAIRGYAELLMVSKDTISEEQRGIYLQNIIKRAQQMERIVSDIVELSRMESKGNNEFSFTDVSISEMLDELYMMYSTDVSGSEKKITLDIPDDDLLIVKADPKKISRVFENLISNAINYTKDQAEIKVKAWRSGGGDGPEGTGDGALPVADQRIHITVSDNGIGIPKEALSKIFDRFYRAKNSGQNIKGTGLGLSIVKVIIDKHNAEIEVESTLDVGTTFHITMKPEV